MAATRPSVFSAPADVGRLEDRLGYRFKDRRLLQRALTHRSHTSALAGDGGSYERLEFLGDRVLGLVIAETLYARFPDADEGDLALRFSALVKAKTLAKVAEGLDLGAYVVLSRGENEAGSRTSHNLLSDVCEALIGALFIDGGWALARAMVNEHWAPLLATVAAPERDARTALQEWAQRRGLPLPVYTTLEVSGPGHQLSFSVEVSVSGLSPMVATGPSKRAAGKAAAELLLRTVT